MRVLRLERTSNFPVLCAAGTQELDGSKVAGS